MPTTDPPSTDPAGAAPRTRHADRYTITVPATGNRHAPAGVATVVRTPGTDAYADPSGLLRVTIHPHPDGTATACPLPGSALHGSCLRAHPATGTARPHLDHGH